MMMKIALLGNYATQFIAKSLKREAKANNIELKIYEGDFNAIDLEIINPASGLYLNDPEYIIIHESDLNIRESFYNTKQGRNQFANIQIDRLSELLKTIQQRLPKSKIIYPIPSFANDNVFGNYYAKVDESFGYQSKKYNWLLLELANQTDNLFLIEPPSLQNIQFRDWTQVINADLHYTPHYLDALSASIIKHIQVIKGSFAKCLIMDLDNTLWGGIIGDDGVEGIKIGSIGIGKAFQKLQKWIKELKSRGIILAVCSKNNIDTAKIPFETHSEMVLRLDDIAVFTANWESKADNINQIQKILNIGFDSMVFIDDNPAEREIVRTYLPQIIVPELPIDPAEYLDFLINGNYFDTTSYSKNDGERTKQYQEEALRQNHASSITNFDDYLASLEMKASVTNFDPSEFDRIAQLTQRSNQFNLKTIRYDIADIKNIALSNKQLKYAVTLKDKFGDYGIISVVIIDINEKDKTASIDTWLMSCRVLKRGVEFYIHNKIMGDLKKIGIKTLFGEYLPTAKNALVLELLDELGFKKEIIPTEYQINVSEFVPHKTFIKTEENNGN